MQNHTTWSTAIRYLWLSEAQHGQAVECTTSSWPCSTQKPTQENKSVNKCSARGTQQGKTAPREHGKDMKFTTMGKGAESTIDGAIVI